MVYRYGRMTVEELIKWEILQREKELLEELHQYEDDYYINLYEANGGDFIYG